MPTRQDAGEDLRPRFAKAFQDTGLTQAQVADRLGLSEGTISKKLRGDLPLKVRDVEAMERLAERSKRPVEKVPRGTSGAPARDGNGPEQPRFTWSRVVALPRVRAFLRAFGDELHELAATPDEEDEAVRSVRESGDLAYNAERRDWTEEEAIQLMEIPAEGLRRYFAGLKRRRQ